MAFLRCSGRARLAMSSFYFFGIFLLQLTKELFFVFKMMNNKQQTLTDDVDISWILPDVECWIYQPEQQSGPIYIKGVVKSINQLNFNKGNSKTICFLQNGIQIQTKASCLQKRRHGNSIERDLISLDVINPAQILIQLKKRFEDKKIHTFMWNSLIIVNPFVRIESMYDQKVMKIYHDRIITQKRSMHQAQPHIYGFVCDVLNNMRVSQKYQMINISGQSGSGKTETNKQCLKIISYICESHAKTSKLTQSVLIQERIVHCDNILECFGNSKTSKNDNSSRFGKLVTQKLNTKQMEILECDIKVFFLEKSRVVHQSQGERNFHIFYMLLTYCPDNLKSHLGFKNKSGQELSLKGYNYIEKHSAHIREQDKQMWNSLNQSFNLLDITETLKKQIFEVVAAVLHLGNLQFDQSTLTDNDPCEIMNEDLMSTIAGLLMIEPKALKEALTLNKKIIAGQTFNIPMTQKQCVQSRDSMAKALYENLFLWIVEQLNKKVNENSKPHYHVKIIKMLDIYGFQVFDHNSFEQLCVNYTNERIHQLYLDQVFKNEKMLLRKQGLENIIPQLKFTDNSKIIQILDTNPKSIFNLLDESCVLNLKDQDYLNSVKRTCEGHENFPTTNNFVLKKCFIIKHTPGEIQYMTVGFRDKNKDFVREDFVQKFSKSKSLIISDRFSRLYAVIKTEINKKFLGFKIRKQISNLITQMSSNSDIHFIRCIKPNDAKLPLTFVERVCFNQIKYLGILDTVRMRKDCYHVRVPYKQFYRKFGVLKGDNTREMIEIQSGNTGNIDFKEKVKELMKENFKSAQLDYLFGNEKFFMKMETNNYLQAVYKQKTKKLSHAATVIKVIYRNRHKRNERKNFSVHIRKVQRALRSYLRDIILIKRKNAVKIIERQWIERSQFFFRRKKMIPLKAIQKYIKKIIQKKKYQAQHSSIIYAKNMIANMKKTHEAADRFQLHMAIKQDLLSKIYDKIWKKMSFHYSKIPQKYLKTLASNARNKIKIHSAQQKANNRILLRVRDTIQRYFKSVFWANRYQTLHNNIVKVQKYCRMSLYRKKHDLFDGMAKKIQRSYRNYRIFKQYSMRKIMRHFRSVIDRQNQWRNALFRNLNQSKISQDISAVDQILQKFEAIKKDKIVLFYFLLDVQIFCNEPSLDKWIQNYLYLSEDLLLKLNPLQYLDVSNTHTVASSTSKVYTWGDTNNQIQQYQASQGKLAKIYASDGATRIDSINPINQEFIGKNVNQKQLSNQNKQWSTSMLNFVLLNGIVLTMQSTSFTKLNTPQKISQLACGMGHVICKTILKKVYTWGSNQKGQLGTGNFFDTNSMQPNLVQFFYKKRIPVNQVAASPQGSIVLDMNSKLYWFGSNGTINMVCNPQQVFLNSKSIYIGNHVKYSPVRIVSRWSKTLSTIGITLACHDDILKNQISLRKKVLENLMMKWSQDAYLINPPYSQSVADHISERHMPLPSVYNGPVVNSRNPTNKEIRQQIISDIRKLQQAEKQLLRARKLEQRQEPRRRYG